MRLPALFRAAAPLALLLSPAHGQPKNPDTFTYAIIGDADSLDPAWQYDGISHEIQYQIYETLVFYKGPSVSEFEPMLSRVVPSRENGLLSQDGLRYAFPIRKNVKFHDGTPLTPEDVRYSILRFLLTDRASGPSTLLLEPLLGVFSVTGPDGKPLPGIFKEAEKAVTIEAGALVLKLKKPAAPLLSILAGFCPVVSKSFVVAHGGWDGSEGSWTRHLNPSKQDAALYDRANGTGPFKLERWDKENRAVILSRNEDYWRKPAALKRVIFKTVPEAATRKLMLKAGDADAAFLERQFLPQFERLEGVTVTDDLPFLEIHNVFVPNFKITMEGNPYVGSGKLDGDGITSDFFSDMDVRKGLAHSFDYDAYIRDGYRGKGRRARGPVPFGVLGHNPRQTLLNFDPAKAAEHFKKAFGGRLWETGFRFTVLFMEGRADRQLACQILKAQVEALNPKFHIEVRGVQWSTYLSHFSAGRIPIANARWAMDFPDPHNAVQPFLHSAGHYAKRQGYANPRADALVERAWGETDPEKRKALYAELQSIARTDLPQIYTIDTYHLQVRRSWVKGWYYNPIVVYGYLYPVRKD